MIKLRDGQGTTRYSLSASGGAFVSENSKCKKESENSPKIRRKGTMDELLTVKQVSELLKINIDCVHELRKAGALPFCKLGRFKCRRTAVEAFIRNIDGMDYTDPAKPRELVD